MVQYFPIVTGSLTVTGSVLVSGGITASGGISISGSIASASFASTASFVALAQSASNAVAAQTASYANAFNVAGNLTAQTLIVQTITSSVVYSSGSNVFGNNIANTQVMTGSVTVTGSLAVVTNGTEFQITSTGGRLGNALTDSHIISGSLTVNPNGLFVSSSGLVGIGTTSPNSALEIKASGTSNSIRLGSLPIDNTYNLVSLNGTGAEGQYIGFAAGNSSDTNLYISSGNTGSIFFRNGNGSSFTERMRITSGGNVGIGTSSVTDFGSSYTVLDVYNATVGGYLLARSPNVTGQISVDNNTAMYVQTRTNHPIVFALNNSEKMRITSAGNVGIGTTNPRLAGSGYVGMEIYGASGASLLLTNGGNNITYIYNSASGGDFMIENAGAQIFRAGSSERMRITSGGIIIIGTPSANNSGTNLQVEGTANYGQMALRYSNAASGRHWRVGPDNANNFIVYNENNTGAYINYSATSWTANSDERLKNINKNIENAVEDLMTLRTVNFSWKSDENKKENLGLIAQDVEKVFPQLIDINHDGMLGVRYTELIPVLVKAIQELNTKFEDYKATHP